MAIEVVNNKYCFLQGKDQIVFNTKRGKLMVYVARNGIFSFVFSHYFEHRGIFAYKAEENAVGH